MGAAGLFDPTPPAAPAPASEPSICTRTLLIDGDLLAYLAAHYAGTAADARSDAHAKVVKLLRQLHANRAIVALSDPARRYFRHQLWDQYKPNRKPAPDFLDAAREGLVIDPRAGARMLPGLEADDVVGILATCGSISGDAVIVASDKDLLTVPGRHYRGGNVVEVSAAEADCRHLMQTLTGDSSDGYPGCPGVGPKGAEKVVSLTAYIDSPAGVWQAVVNTFTSRGHSADDALIQARLARICRATEFDFQTKTVRLWQPPAFDAAPSAKGAA